MKYISIIALAAVSMSAFAQNSDWQKKSMDMSSDWAMKQGIALDKPVSEQSTWDVKKAVWMHANDYMLAGDVNRFRGFTNRMPTNEEMALFAGLASVLQESLVMQTGYNNFELNGTGTALKGIIAWNKGLGPDTYAILDNPQPMAMDSASRPQRFSTWSGAPMIETDYDATWKAISGNLNDTQKGVLLTWWMGADSRDKDVVSHFVNSAVKAHALNYYSALRGNWDY